jgi:hypothetical protein
LRICACIAFPNSVTILVRLKLRAHDYNPTLYGGLVRVPSHALSSIESQYSNFVSRNEDSGCLTFIAPSDPRSLSFPGPPGMNFIVYDTHGESHARSQLDWLFNAREALVMCQNISYFQFMMGRPGADAVRNRTTTWSAPYLVSDIRSDLLTAIMSSFTRLSQTNSDLAAGSLIMFEQLGKV